MKGGHEAATAADESFGTEIGRQLHHLHAGLHPDRFGPAAEQSFVGAIADTVDASFRATSRLAGDETVVAVVTGLVDVEEGDDVAFLDRRALDVGELASRRFNDADGDVAGDDREWDVEAAVVEVDVGSADLRIERPEQRCPGFEVRSCNVPDFQGLAG